jgi:LmbE family N-acetylglucosaminyl deacetylase
MHNRRLRQGLLALLVLLVLVGTIALLHWLALSHALYTLNLQAKPELRIMSPPRAGDNIVIFAPHEDDETLGCAGYIQQAVAVGAHIHVILLTNGEYPEIDVFLFAKALPLSAQPFIKLGYLRQRETLAAMRYLGVPQDNVTFLGYPNEYLNQMWLPAHWLPARPVRSIRTRVTRSPYNNSLTPHAIYCGQSVLRDIETVLTHVQPNIVITLQPHDIHVDHWPTYTFVRFALEELAMRGAPFARQCLVYTYLIHRDHWPAPRGYRPGLRLEPPKGLIAHGDTTWLALPLTIAQTMGKHQATALYHSQGGTLDPLLLSFARVNELFGVLPTHLWPGGTSVGSTEVIDDPAADQTSSALNPHGDILKVFLARNGARMLVTLRVRRAPARNVTYHFSLHAGGASPADRVITEYDWLARRPLGLDYAHEGLRAIPASAMHVQVSGNDVCLSVPWPLDDATRFFLLRAWTTQGQRVIDQTETTLFETPAPIAIPAPILWPGK